MILVAFSLRGISRPEGMSSSEACNGDAASVIAVGFPGGQGTAT